MHTYIYVDVASARMTKQGGGIGDYEYCARKSHTAALRVAASPGPPGFVFYKFLLLLSCATRRW